MPPLKYVAACNTLGCVGSTLMRSATRLPRCLALAPFRCLYSADISAGLPPLPDILDDEIRNRVFTHRSLHGRANTLFQDPADGA